MSDKKFRYSVESWVCDYGIYDNQENLFIGSPLESRKYALEVLKIIETFLSENEKLSLKPSLFLSPQNMYLPKESVQSEKFNSAQ